MKTTPLNGVHKRLGAKMVDFHGWEMPLQYTSIVAEHMAVRQAVGLFDVSHMGNLIIRGRDAPSLLSKVLTSKLWNTQVGHLEYTHLLDEEGRIIDDMIGARSGENEFMIVPNASMIDEDRDWILSHASGDVVIDDISADTVILALQGPKAAMVLSDLTGDRQAVEGHKFFRERFADLPGVGRCRIWRSGYTGEDGFEIMVDSSRAQTLWDALMASGGPYGIAPIGLGARDTLRLEMGFLLSGTDFHRDRTTLETGWDFAIDWDHDFIGKSVLERQKDSGVRFKLRGLILDRGIPREGYVVKSTDGKEIARLTSAGVSPVLKKGIAMAYLPVDYAEKGTQLLVEIRGKEIPAVVVKPPFVGNG